MVFSIFTLALLFGPLVFIPISEAVGRLWVFHAGAALLVAFNIACAYAPSVGTLLAFRFLAGLGGAAVSVGEAIVIDVWRGRMDELGKRRTTVASVLSTSVGSALGPIISGQITEKVGLKWIFLVCGIACGVAGLLGVVCLRETCPHVLRRKIHRRQMLDGEQQHKSDQKFRTARMRFQLFAINAWYQISGREFDYQLRWPIPLLYVGLVSGIYYLLLASFPAVFQEMYAFNVGETGLVYLGPSTGIFLSMALGLFLHRIDGHLPHSAKKANPRMLVFVFAVLTVPVGLFIYGWTVQERSHFITPIIGASYFTFTMAAIFFHVRYYVVGGLHPGMSVAQFTFGFAFPLFGKQMLDKLGNGPAYSILVGLTVVFGVIIPLILYFGTSPSRRLESALWYWL